MQAKHNKLEKCVGDFFCAAISHLSRCFARRHISHPFLFSPQVEKVNWLRFDTRVIDAVRLCKKRMEFGFLFLQRLKDIYSCSREIIQSMPLWMAQPLLLFTSFKALLTAIRSDTFCIPLLMEKIFVVCDLMYWLQWMVKCFCTLITVLAFFTSNPWNKSCLFASTIVKYYET